MTAATTIRARPAGGRRLLAKARARCADEHAGIMRQTQRVGIFRIGTGATITRSVCRSVPSTKSWLPTSTNPLFA